MMSNAQSTAAHAGDFDPKMRNGVENAQWGQSEFPAASKYVARKEG